MSDIFAAPAEDADALARAAASLGRVSADLATDRRRTTSAVTAAVDGWSGPRSTTFDRAAGGVQVQLRIAEEGCAEVATVLRDYSRSVAAARHDLADLGRLWALAPATDLLEQAVGVRRDLAARAAAAALRIDAVTSRVAPVCSTLSPAEIRRQVTAQLGAASMPPDPSIADALAALLGARRAVPGTALRDDDTVEWSTLDHLPEVPAPGTSPAAVHLWWTSTSPTQQDALIRLRGHRVGNLDGVPVAARDAANRLALPRALAALRSDLAALGDPPPRTLLMGPGRPVHNLAHERWLQARADLEQRIAGVEAIRLRLRLGANDPPSYLIGFRPRVGHGRAVVAQGDPDTAGDVSTFVTGTTTRLGGIGADLDRSRAMADAAVRAGARPTSLAVVTWYGYDAPQTILPQAASLSYAAKGAPLLERFLAGLRATHRGPRSHNTVVAHSYGSTLAGYAANHGHELAVDDVVLVASPGAGVGNGWLGTGTVEDLHLDGPSAGHVYATRSRADAIRHAVGTHLGEDPTSPGFGATTFGSDPQGDHSAYWADPHNPALVAMGQVIAGHGAVVAPATADEDPQPSIDTSIIGGPA